MTLPENERPLTRYTWVNTSSILLQIILFAMPWINWTWQKPHIIREILTNRYVQVASAKNGFWIKYELASSARKIMVEIFVKVVPNRE